MPDLTPKQQVDRWVVDLAESTEALWDLLEGQGPAQELDSDLAITRMRQVASDHEGLQAAWARWARAAGMTGHEVAQSLMISRSTLYHRYG